jgi:hypothetical protein
MSGVPNCYRRFEHKNSACAKMGLKYLDDQKARRIEISAEMFEWLETEPVSLNRVIKNGKSWFSNVTLKP